jgi:hypothetical protein
LGQRLPGIADLKEEENKEEDRLITKSMPLPVGRIGALIEYSRDFRTALSRLAQKKATRMRLLLAVNDGVSAAKDFR